MHSSIELTTSVYRSILSHLVGIEERKDEEDLSYVSALGKDLMLKAPGGSYKHCN